MSTGNAHWLGVGGIADVNRDLILSESCDDIVGNFGGTNPFTLTRSPSAAFIRNGQNKPSNGFAWRFTNFPCLSGGGPYSSPGNPEPTDNQMLSRGLANSNPNKPVVDLPLFVFELRDIPDVIREWGAGILRTRNRWKSPNGTDPLRDIPMAAAKRHLEYQFGIAPVISDVAKMLQFQASMDKRIHTLKDLSKGSTTRHATVYSDSVQEPSWSPSTFLTGLYQETSKVRWKMTTDRHYWVSTRWNTTMALPESDIEQKILANKLIFGMHGLSVETVWNSLPWSWLVDWFSNIGDLAASTRNHIPVTHSGSCIMKHTRKYVSAWEWTVEPSGGKQTLYPVNTVAETKIRYAAPLVVYPEFYLPLLSGGQLSILSALAVLKESGRRLK